MLSVKMTSGRAHGHAPVALEENMATPNKGGDRVVPELNVVTRGFRLSNK